MCRALRNDLTGSARRNLHYNMTLAPCFPLRDACRLVAVAPHDFRCEKLATQCLTPSPPSPQTQTAPSWRHHPVCRCRR